MLAGLAAAPVQGLVALGPRAGARVQRYGEPPEDVEPVEFLERLAVLTPRPRITFVSRVDG